MRVPLTDPRDLQLVVADFRTGDIKQISRRGRGPGGIRKGAPLHAIAGHVIIRRQPSADHQGVAYFVVDSRGRLVGMIDMKDNERIFAPGARSIYVVETDADDLRYIRRHPWAHSALPPG